MAMTMVIAKAVTASMLTCCVMLRRLRPVMKVPGSSTQNRRTSSRKHASVP